MRHPGQPLRAVAGSLETEESTADLAAAVDLDTVDAVVVSVNGPFQPTAVAECSWETIRSIFEGSLRPHVNAARLLIPRLRAGATYLAIGGGMADAIIRGMAPAAMTQAAQRNFIRSWHRESRESPVAIRELLINSMVNGRSTREHAQPEWLTDAEIGRSVADILAVPDDFPGPVVTISPQDRVGA